MRHRSETHLVISFVNRFSGRAKDRDYDATKPFRLHRRQRAFVWNRDRQLKLADSMIQGLYIPPIICNEYFEDGIKKCDIMEGGNRATTMSRILKGLVRELTDDERRKVERYEIEVILMNNLQQNEQREMFRRLNNSVKVSDGHLYAMSEDDSLLVQEALALLNDPDYPLRARITGAFFDTIDADNNGRVNLSNAIAIVSGAVNGVEFITKSFARQESKVESAVPIIRDHVVSMVNNILHIFERADKEIPLNSRTKQKAQWSIGWALGAIIYDLTMNSGDIEHLIEKWTRWLVAVRRGDAKAKDAIEIKGAQNINPDKLKRKCYNVNKFLDTGDLATEDELKGIKHGLDNDTDEDEEEVYSDTNE